MIIKVIYDDIIMQYNSFNELLLNNESNLKSKVLTVYTDLLDTKYRLITSYYS